MKRTAGQVKIHKPVFFIGMPRSGTTVIFEKYSIHEDVGWLSRYVCALPSLPSLELLSRIFDNRFLLVRAEKKQGRSRPAYELLLPKPKEGYEFWKYYSGEYFLLDGHPEELIDDKSVTRLRTAVGKIIQYQGKKRFVAKLTGPPRIKLLQRVFPDARFVHIIRDGRAVVQSLLNVGFWKNKGGLERPFWNRIVSGEDVERWEQSGRSPVALAAIQWRNIMVQMRMEAEGLTAGQYAEMKYEDFIENPHGQLSNLYGIAGLSDSRRAHTAIDSMDIQLDSNMKYLQMPENDIRIMEDIMGKQLREYGYTV